MEIQWTISNILRDFFFSKLMISQAKKAKPKHQFYPETTSELIYTIQSAQT